jgi:hypothetical protein
MSEASFNLKVTKTDAQKSECGKTKKLKKKTGEKVIHSLSLM